MQVIYCFCAARYQMACKPVLVGVLGTTGLDAISGLLSFSNQEKNNMLNRGRKVKMKQEYCNVFVFKSPLYKELVLQSNISCCSFFN